MSSPLSIKYKMRNIEETRRTDDLNERYLGIEKVAAMGNVHCWEKVRYFRVFLGLTSAL